MPRIADLYCFPVVHMYYVDPLMSGTRSFHLDLLSRCDSSSVVPGELRAFFQCTASSADTFVEVIFMSTSGLSLNVLRTSLVNKIAHLLHNYPCACTPRTHVGDMPYREVCLTGVRAYSWPESGFSPSHLAPSTIDRCLV